MPSPNISQEFCRKVCSYIKYKRVHYEITQELKNHIEDHQENLIETGLNQDEAEKQAVEAMGDPEEIGKELDKQHRPLVEWMLSITNLVTAIGLLYIIGVIIFVVFMGLISLGSLNYSVEKEDILYTQKLSEKQKVGGLTYQLKKMIVTDDNTILIEYSTYGNNFDIIFRGWSAFSLRAHDKDGKAYDQKGSGKGGLYSRSQIVIEDFDRGEKSIFLKAFSYYGDVEFQIPLQEVR